jgi:toxin ParE1/3/4
MKWEVELTKDALRDMKGIYDYISDNLHVPETATEQVARIKEATDSLDFMPFRHPLCEYEPFRSDETRVLPVDNFLVFYVPDKARNVVSVVRVIYGRRDIENI